MNNSSDEQLLNLEVQKLLFSLCEVLYKNGIREIQVGALLRICGFDPAIASEHDCEILMLDEDFKEQFGKTDRLELDLSDPIEEIEIPPGTTFH